MAVRRFFIARIFQLRSSSRHRQLVPVEECVSSSFLRDGRKRDRDRERRNEPTSIYGTPEGRLGSHHHGQCSWRKRERKRTGAKFYFSKETFFTGGREAREVRCGRRLLTKGGAQFSLEGGTQVLWTTIFLKCTCSWRKITRVCSAPRQAV